MTRLCQLFLGQDMLSSMTFGVTTMMGMFTGHILKDAERTPLRKCYTLLLIGAMLVAAGWLWGLQMPVIKKLWTNSLLFGLKAYVNGFYPALIAIANAAIVYLILYVMYRQQVFLNV